MNGSLCYGEELLKLLPQREPIRMVDTLHQWDEQGCRTGLYIRKDNMFCVGEVLSAEGVIEHMAQSASLHPGYRSVRSGEPVKTGYIGEIRNFELTAEPRVGETLETTVRIVSEVMGITLVSAETRCGNTPVAACRMKISV